MDEYVIPNYSKKRRKDRPDTRIMTFAEKLGRERSSLQNDPGWLSKVNGMLREALNQLRWTEKPSLCCLGLGSPSDSRSARLQLALILELLSNLDVPTASASFYDPVFTDEDMKELHSLGIHAVCGEDALNTTHVFSQPTLVIMPHCDIELYKKVLESNWSRQGLSKILVLGNPLDQYLLTISKERLNVEFPSVQLIANHTNWCTAPLPELTCDDKAFVALAFQYLTTREGQQSDELPPWGGKPSRDKDSGHKHFPNDYTQNGQGVVQG